MYYIGIDGGGTKTDFLLTDENGKVLANAQAGSLSYKHVGKEECLQTIEDYLHVLSKKASFTGKEEIYTCLAFPNFGESKESDRYFEESMKQFSTYHIHLVNDAKAGWAGSLALQPGINLVAGTGTIAYGRNGNGKSERAGGWNDVFSDEGSCNWLGKAALELFAKEADGRLEKGSLYAVIRSYFELEDDFEIIDIFEKKYGGNRRDTAQLQKLLLDAAKRGDRYALRQYDKAAYELSLMVFAVTKKLELSEETLISYSGGLFHAGEIIMGPFQEYLKKGSFLLQAPRYTPVQGAVLLAAEHWSGKTAASRIIETWQ